MTGNVSASNGLRSASSAMIDGYLKDCDIPCEIRLFT